MTRIEARAAARRLRRLVRLHAVLAAAPDRTAAVVAADGLYGQADALLRRLRALPLTLWSGP